MCLFIKVRAKSEADQAVMDRGDRLPTRLDWAIGRHPVAAQYAHLHACELVRDWDRPSGWKLTQAHRQALHADLSELFRELTGELVVTAVFEPEPVDAEVSLTRPAMLDLVLSNRLLNRVRYTVMP